MGWGKRTFCVVQYCVEIIKREFSTKHEQLRVSILNVVSNKIA